MSESHRYIDSLVVTGNNIGICRIFKIAGKAAGNDNNLITISPCHLEPECRIGCPGIAVDFYLKPAICANCIGDRPVIGGSR
jgi:hypothetical protein